MKKQLSLLKWIAALSIFVITYSCILNPDEETIDPTITTSSTIPSAPSQVAVTDVTFNSAKVSWKAPVDTGTKNGEVAPLGRYELQFDISPQFTSPTTYYVQNTDTIISNLSSKTIYYFRVRSSNLNGTDRNKNSEFALLSSPSEKISTLEIPPLGSPTNITFDPNTINSSKGTLSWTAPQYTGEGSGGGFAVISKYIAEYSVNKNYSASKSIETKLTSIDLEDLQAVTTYYLRIKTENSEGDESIYADTIFTTSDLSEAPANVTILTLSLPISDSKRSVKADWDSITVFGKNNNGTLSVLKSYTVSVSDTSDFSSIIEEKVISSTSTTLAATEYTFVTGLSPNKQYFVRVVATNSSDVSSVTSKIADIKTDTDANAPSTVQNFSNTTPTQSSFDVSWEAPADPGTDIDGNASSIIDYTVEIKKKNSTESFTTISNSPITHDASVVRYIVSFSNLKGLTEYTVRVTVNNVVGLSIEQTIDVQTANAAIPPVAFKPNTVVATTVNGALEVTWTATTDKGTKSDGSTAATTITGYKVGYLKKGSATNTATLTTDLNSSATTTTLTGLDNYADYYVWVIAKNEDSGYSQNPTTINATTAIEAKTKSAAVAPAMPSVTLGIATKNSVVVNWTAPTDTGKNDDGNSALINYYEIQYREGTTGDYTPFGSTHTGFSTTVTGLIKGDTDYQFQVRAVNTTPDIEQAGLWSGAQTKKTLSAAEAPDAPTGVTITIASTSTETNTDRYHKVNVSWTAPTNKGKLDDGTDATNIDHYELYYKKTADPVDTTFDANAETYARIEGEATGTNIDITIIGDISDVAARSYVFQVRAVNSATINNTSPDSTASTTYVMPDRPNTITIKVKKFQTSARARYIVYGKDSSGSDIEILRKDNIDTSSRDEINNTDTVTISSSATNTETILSSFYKVNLYNDSFNNDAEWIGTVIVTYLSGLSNQKVISNIPDDDSRDFIFP